MLLYSEMVAVWTTAPEVACFFEIVVRYVREPALQSMIHTSILEDGLWLEGLLKPSLRSSLSESPRSESYHFLLRELCILLSPA